MGIDWGRRLTAVATGGLSEATRVAKTGLEYLTGYTAMEEMSEAQKKQYSQQMQQMEEMSQYGWGYPEWIMDQLEANMDAGKLNANSYVAAVAKLKDLYGEKLDLKPYKATLDKALAVYKKDMAAYVAQLNKGGTESAYKELAKQSWNQSFQALTEVPGMTEGQRLAAMSTLTEKYGTALTQAGIAGEEERVRRAGLAYMAKMGYDTTAMEQELGYEQLGLATEQDWLTSQKAYGGLQLQSYGASQALREDPLRAAFALPNRYPRTVTPPLEAPSFGAYLGSMAGQVGMTALGAYLGGTGPFAAAGAGATAMGGGTATYNYTPQFSLAPNPYGG